MTCAEFKALVGAFVLEALEPDERAACQTHLKSAGPHEGCAEALLAAQRATAALSAALPPIRPPAAVWDQIEAALGAAPAPARPARTGWYVAAAIAAVAAAALVFMWRDGRQAAQHAQAREDAVKHQLGEVIGKLADRDQTLALLARPGTLVVTLARAQGTEGPQAASAIVNLADRRVLVIATNLAPVSDKDYELWVIRGDQKLAAGILRATEDGRIVASVDPALLSGGVDALAITLEPAGGGPAPRGPIVLVGALPKT